MQLRISLALSTKRLNDYDMQEYFSTSLTLFQEYRKNCFEGKKAISRDCDSAVTKILRRKSLEKRKLPKMEYKHEIVKPEIHVEKSDTAEEQIDARCARSPLEFLNVPD